MDVTEKEVVPYVTPDGKIPFFLWMDTIKDRQITKIIISRLDRVQTGNYGDCKPVGGGVLELRFKIGIRIYFAEYDNTVVILFHGGNKSSQEKDIAKAKEYWYEFKNREQEIDHD
jgi:putative addiction module killer protein